MQQPPDHYDADLLLRLYDLRREEKLRKARDWFAQEFHADSFEDFLKRYPYGSEGNTFYRMVVDYWDMAASLLNHGLIHEDLFFENNAELLGVWIRIENLVPRIRETWKSPRRKSCLLFASASNPSQPGNLNKQCGFSPALPSLFTPQQRDCLRNPLSVAFCPVDNLFRESYM